jgi:hypothetical protein
MVLENPLSCLQEPATGSILIQFNPATLYPHDPF